MDYFRVQQLPTTSNYLCPKFDYEEKKFWNTDQPILCNYREEDQSLPTLPLYDQPTLIVSTQIQKILQNFQSNLAYRPLYYGHEHSCKGFIMRLPKLECLHHTTVFYKNGWLKTPVLDRSKIGANKAFSITGIVEAYFVLDLEIMEHILYTQTTQFLFEPMQVWKGKNI